MDGCVGSDGRASEVESFGRAQAGGGVCDSRLSNFEVCKVKTPIVSWDVNETLNNCPPIVWQMLFQSAISMYSW